MGYIYENTEEQFNEFVEGYRKKIRDMFFSEIDLEKGVVIRNDLISAKKIDEGASVEDAIRQQKLDLLELKLDHTMRIVKDVALMSKGMELDIDFIKVLKTSALLHDIARFPQTYYSTGFNDRAVKEFKGKYHGEHGFNMLVVNKDFKKFSIPNKVKPAIGYTVKHHQDGKLPAFLSKQLTDLSDLDIGRLTGSYDLNESEQLVASALVQMVKDVDQIDILYQNKTGEFPVTRPSVVVDVDGSLAEISEYWGITKEEIMIYNNLSNSDLTGKETLNIPLANVKKEKLREALAVAGDIQDKFFNNEYLDLRELQNRKDWTFITGMWWRLSHFLNMINFNSYLEVLKTSDLLDSIYDNYPDEYKPLVEKAFIHAKEIIEKRINLSLDGIYAGKLR
ncbi:MAG: HD domain-containing protein [Mycoplasmatota bacterium]